MTLVAFGCFMLLYFIFIQYTNEGFQNAGRVWIVHSCTQESCLIIVLSLAPARGKTINWQHSKCMNVRSTRGLSSETEFYHYYIYLRQNKQFYSHPFMYLRQIRNYGFLAEFSTKRYDFWNVRLVYGSELVVKNIEI